MYTAEIISITKEQGCIADIGCNGSILKDEIVISSENLNPYARATKMILSL